MVRDEHINEQATPQKKTLGKTSKKKKGGGSSRKTTLFRTKIAPLENARTGKFHKGEKNPESIQAKRA